MHTRNLTGMMISLVIAASAPACTVLPPAGHNRYVVSYAYPYAPAYHYYAPAYYYGGVHSVFPYPHYGAFYGPHGGGHDGGYSGGHGGYSGGHGGGHGQNH